jgi:hypothetical protein
MIEMDAPILGTVGERLTIAGVGGWCYVADFGV